MAVKDVRHAQDFGSLQHGAAIKREALRVIWIIARGSAVERFTVKERRVVDEVEFHTGAFASIQNGAETVLVVKGNGQAAQQDFRIRQLGLSILGQVHGNGVPQFSQGRGKRAYNIGQSAGFGKGHAFRSGKDNVHGSPWFLI